MRAPLALGLSVALLLALGSAAEAADPPPNTFADTTAPGSSGFLIRPAEAQATAAGGLIMNGLEITPPTGGFSVGSFELGTTRDATHGVFSRGPSCVAPSGTATVLEAAGDALAVDIRGKVCSEDYAVVMRRASSAPFPLAALGTNVPRNVPYAGGTYKATVFNSGTTDLVPGVMTVASATGGTVSLSDDLCNGVTLPPGSSCAVTLTVKPMSEQFVFALSTPVPSLPFGKVQRAFSTLGGTPPGQVTNVHVTAAALDHVTLAWDKPADDGGNPLRYSVLRGGYGIGSPTSETTATVDLRELSSVTLTVIANNRTGYGPDSDPLTVPARSGEALVVLRPDGKEWAAQPEHLDQAVPTDLFPGGAPVGPFWIGNKDDRTRATDLRGNPYGFDGGPASSYFSGTGEEAVFVRTDAAGTPSVFRGFPYTADSVPLPVVRGYTQPTANGRGLFAIPATKAGPSGGSILELDRDGVTRRLLAGTTRASHPAASPDGRWLAYVQPNPSGGQYLRVRTLGNRGVRVLTSPQAFGDVTSVAWSLDAASLFVYDDGTKVLTRVPVDPVAGFGVPEVVATGSEAGPARFATDRHFQVSANVTEGGLYHYGTTAGGTVTCRLDDAVRPCGSGTYFAPHAAPGQHLWTMTEELPGHLTLTVGSTGLSYRALRDFTGDGKADLAVFRPSNGRWYVRGLPSVHWGQRGDKPLLSDFNGDGRVDIAVFRPSTRTWHIQGRDTVQFGSVNDVPMPGDYDGDGKDDIAVYRPSTGQWLIRGQQTQVLGGPGDLPFVGRWFGSPRDGRARPAVCRPATGTLYVSGAPGRRGECPTSGGGTPFSYDTYGGYSVIGVKNRGELQTYAYGGVPFGTANDVQVVASYLGDDVEELAVFRPSNGRWYIRGLASIPYGTRGDIPL